MKIIGENPFKNSPTPEKDYVRAAINSVSGCIIKVGEQLCHVSQDGYGGNIEVEKITPRVVMSESEFIKALEQFKK